MEPARGLAGSGSGFRKPSGELPGTGGMQAEVGCRGDVPSVRREVTSISFPAPMVCKSGSPAASPTELIKGEPAGCRAWLGGGNLPGTAPPRGMALRWDHLFAHSARSFFDNISITAEKSLWLQTSPPGSPQPEPPPAPPPPQDDISAWSQSQQNMIVLIEMLGWSISNVGRSSHFPVSS